MGPLHKVFWKCTRAYNENAFQQTGHNKQKCKLDLVPKPPKLSCGRPFKNSKATTQSPLTDEPWSVFNVIKYLCDNLVMSL